MKGYFIGRINVHNQESYKEYAKKAGEAVKKFGGNFLARGGKHQIMEGLEHTRHVIIEFKDFQTAVNFYNSKEYSEARAIRKNKAEFNGVIVEGT